MRLARGWCNYFGPNEKFVVIDTEEKRALYKKSRHQPWDWIDFQPPFTPERTWEALAAVKGYRAVILDSTSHEYAGEGGLQEIAEEELERLSGGRPQEDGAPGRALVEAREAPPQARVHGPNLIRYPTLIICCLRAEPKVKFLKEKFRRGDGSEGEKTTIVDAGFQPICEKMFMYEMLASFMMYAERAGIPEQVKALEEDLKPIFLLGQADRRGHRRAPRRVGRRARSCRAPNENCTGEDGRIREVRRGYGPPPVFSGCGSRAGEDLGRAGSGHREAPRGAPGAGRQAVRRGQHRRGRASSRSRRHDRAVAWIKKHAKPVVDEASTLLRIDSAKTRDDAAEILDGVREQPFYARATEAFTNRWNLGAPP
jgi:hypothetical protein